MAPYHYGIILAKHDNGAYTILDYSLGKMILKSQDLRASLPIGSGVRYEYEKTHAYARYLFDLEFMIDGFDRRSVGLFQSICTLCYYALASEQPSPEMYLFILECHGQDPGSDGLMNLCILASLSYKLGVYPCSSHLFSHSFLLLISHNPETMVKCIQETKHMQEIKTLGMWVKSCCKEILPPSLPLHAYIETIIQDAYELL